MWNLEIAKADACWSRKVRLLSASRRLKEAVESSVQGDPPGSRQRLGAQQQLEHRRCLERREDGGTQLKVGDGEIVDADRGG